ncbi:MAG: DUF1559 domain-containing protein [Planctomycetaceae bacterium]
MRRRLRRVSIQRGKTGCRTGVTIVEVLIVVAIISILVAILLPAVQQSRATARKVQCADRLRQIGLAIHNFESTHHELPGGIKWRIQLLPYLDQQPLYDRLQGYFDRLPNQTPKLAAWRLTSGIPAFICPADLHADREIVSYYGNMGRALEKWGFDGVIVPPLGPGFYYGAINVPHTQGAVRLADITDGLSNTVAVSEAISGQRPGPSSVRADNVSRLQFLRTFWQTGPDLPTDASFEDRLQYCKTARERGAPSAGGERGWDAWPIVENDGSISLGAIIHGWAYDHALVPNSPSCGGSYWGFYSATSLHSGGVNALRCDGSAAAFSESVDLGVWRDLASRNRGIN